MVGSKGVSGSSGRSQVTGSNREVTGGDNVVADSFKRSQVVTERSPGGNRGVSDSFKRSWVVTERSRVVTRGSQVVIRGYR